MIHGFDISGFQGTTAPSGDFVFVKATEGSGYTNSRFPAQYKSAKARGKVRGAYHFARPEQSSAKSQCHRFLDTVQPTEGEVYWLDLEASKLNQADTNRWARDFGDEMRAEAAWMRTGAYLDRGYVANNTGRDLSRHFNLWWFPQYPNKYLLRRLRHVAMRARGVHPRSADAPRKVPIARATSLWPPAFTPALPSVNTTGWSKPHIWQFTDNFGGLDASISTLTLAQLAGKPAPNPTPPPAPKPLAWPGRYLHYKVPLMRGDDVRTTQRLLIVHHREVKVDGEYGVKTRDAVKAFQRAAHLTADGEVGPKTWAALAK